MMNDQTVADSFAAFVKLPPAERVAYLKDQAITTEQQAFMDGSKCVGDPAAVVVRYRAMIRGIRIGGWHARADLAIADAAAYLEDFDGEI